MAITSLALILVTAIDLMNQVKNYRTNLRQDMEVLVDFVSHNAASSIAFDDNISEQENLEALAVANYVLNAHIYKSTSAGQNVFFASYNKSGQTIESVADRVEQLEVPFIRGNIIEISRPILIEDRKVGYAYIRGSTENLNLLITKSVVRYAVILLLSLLLCLAITLYLQQKITRPLNTLAQEIESVAREKNYDARAGVTQLIELNVLSNAFNVLLSRIQDHIQRQEKVEEEHQKLHLSLEEKVNLRTNALKEANQELIRTLEKLHQFQRQMVENEKMASLGDMVAGVAHEVNTPIGLGVTASTMMLDRLKQLHKDFDDKTLKASALSKFMVEGEENLNIIYRNLNRAAELISSFKQVAVDQTNEVKRTFSFEQLMNEILLSLRPRLKKHQHKIQLHYDPDLIIESKAGPINQIIINLIMNSVIHGFEGMESGTIDIHATMLGSSKLNIVYKDDGKGIPENLRKRIFDPFVTTKRGQGGSGLGMHLVYNLVTQGLNGSISINSTDHSGVEFQIIFPVEQKSALELAKSL
ncbi:HAMP domain-containing protein [Alteromonadaceae bacterium M269]|nr:HAMP domain-containing protein [Alteromonadaceae bacterium M269]